MDIGGWLIRGSLGVLGLALLWGLISLFLPSKKQKGSGNYRGYEARKTFESGVAKLKRETDASREKSKVVREHYNPPKG